MAGVILPIYKGVYVCDDVVLSPVGAKPMNVNLWDTYRATTAALPIVVKKLCAFAWLRGGRGRVTFRVDVVSARTGDPVGRTPTYAFDFTEPNGSVFGKFLITDFHFPEPGQYIVELICDNRFFDDQPIRVLLPRETNP